MLALYELRYSCTLFVFLVCIPMFESFLLLHQAEAKMVSLSINWGVRCTVAKAYCVGIFLVF